VHLNVLQERRLAALAPPPVEALECLRTLREPGAGREQQKEREQHRNVHRDRADGVPPQRNAQLARQPGAAVVLRPALLVAEAKASAEDIVVRALTVMDPARESRLSIDRIRLLACRRVEVEIRLDAAREHIGGGSAPECAHQAAAAIPR
jgi:hypothetical protein